jgi:DNA-binding NtrC family response regulator/ABC-type nitrate/sulfonate/bicarbonate transport system substrate-binding protein
LSGDVIVGDASYNDAPSLRPTSDIARAIFADPDSRAIEERLALLAPSDATVLIIGETGTGKEVAAREMHALSGRHGPFLAVNCAALADASADAELFGHQPDGASDAEPGQLGWFEAASGGTLLLDEVGELSPRLQTKLLRVLQEKEITRVGSRTTRRIDTRVIAATNMDLHAAVERGAFRRDLLFRLDIATLVLRPLRERRADIEPLALHFLDRYGEKLSRPLTFAPEALAALVRHDWPGNVRELDNVIHRAVLLSGSDVIALSDLSHTASRSTGRPPGRVTLEDVLRPLADGWVQGHEPDLLRRVTRVLIQAGFESAGGNQVRAAEVLGVSRNTLRTELGHLGIIPPRRRHAEVETREQPRLRIGIQKFGTSALLHYDEAFATALDAQGVRAEWQDFQTGPPLINALHAVQIDICSTGEISPVVAQASGTPLVYLAYEQAEPTSVALMVRASSPIEAVTDLRGRRVALSRGTNVELMLIRALQSSGMTLNDIQPIYMPPRLHPAPDTIDGVDAWAMWDPFLADTQGSDRFRVLLDGTGLIANRRFYVTRRQCLDSIPKLLDTALVNIFRAGRQAAAAPRQTAERLAGRFGIAADRLEISMRRLGPGARWLDPAVVADQQRIADELHRLGVTPKPVCVADAVWLPGTHGLSPTPSATGPE